LYEAVPDVSFARMKSLLHVRVIISCAIVSSLNVAGECLALTR